MINFLEETTQVMLNNGKSPADIIFIGSESSGHSCSWEEFSILADRKYDSGFGDAKVAVDLTIVFKDGSRMKRKEYYGSEWWGVINPFKVPKEIKPITSLFGRHWYTLAKCQTGENDA